MHAYKKAEKIIEKDIPYKRIVIFTDSKYSLKCIGSYGKKQELKYNISAYGHEQ